MNEQERKDWNRVLDDLRRTLPNLTHDVDAAHLTLENAKASGNRQAITRQSAWFTLTTTRLAQASAVLAAAQELDAITEQQTKPCVWRWKQDDSEQQWFGWWNADCGHQQEYRHPEDWAFCPYCGHPIQEAPSRDDNQEDNQQT